MNAILYPAGSAVITWWVENCTKSGNDFTGTNMALQGVNPDVFDYKWTEETLTGDPETGYNKTADQVAAAPGPGPEFSIPDRAEMSGALERLHWLVSKDYGQVEDYITANVTDLASARAYLIDLSKIVLALIKVSKTRC